MYLSHGDTIDLSYNRIKRLPLYTPTLYETPTKTMWDANGIVMTNPDAQWEVNAPVNWEGLLEIYIISGTNVKIGDNDIGIQSVGSPTRITLKKSIKLNPNGPPPSNVNYSFRSGTHTDLVQIVTPAGKTISNVTIAGNICAYSHHQGFLLQPSGTASNVVVENNLIYGSNWNNPTGVNYAVIFGSNIGNIIFRNNTIVKLVDGDDGKIRIKSGVSPAVFKGNIFYYLLNETKGNIPNSGYNFFVTHRGYGNLGPHSVRLTNLAAFKNLFTNYDNYDFVPKADSMIRGAVPAGIGASTDIDGDNRTDGKPDAGCYEYIPPDSNNQAPVPQLIGNK